MDPVPNDGTDLVQHLGSDPGREVAAGVERHDPAQPAFVQRLLGRGVAGVEAADVTYHELTGRSRRRIHDGLAVCDGGSHGLLQEDVLPGLERRQSGVAVLVPHGGDADAVQPRILQHFPIVGVGLPDLETFGDLGQSFRGPGAQGVDFDSRVAGERFQVLLSEPAQPDDSVSRLVHFPAPGRMRRVPAGGGDSSDLRVYSVVAD